MSQWDAVILMLEYKGSKSDISHCCISRVSMLPISAAEKLFTLIVNGI